MSDIQTKSSLGPAVFVGLSLYVLATGSPVPPPENPAERMDMAALARGAVTARPKTSDAAPTVPVAPRSVRRSPTPHRPAPTAADTPFAALSPLPRLSIFIPAVLAPRAGNTPAPHTPSAGTVPLPPAAPSPIPDVAESDLRPRPLENVTRPAAGPAPGPLATPPSDPSPSRFPHGFLPAPRTRPADLARPAPPPLPLALSLPAPVSVTVTATSVHLRRTPGARAPIRTRFGPGTTALRLETRGNWSRVFFPDHNPPLSGWMYSKYLEETPARP